MIESTPGGNRVSGFYRGKVVAHSTNGKCKIFWPGVTPPDFEDKPDELPDSEQAAPLFAGAANANGVFFYPDIGSFVWGFFANEDVNFPVYFASTLSYKENESTYDNLSQAPEKKDNKIKKICIDDVAITLNSEENSVEIVNTLNGGCVSISKDGKVMLESLKEIKILAPKITVNANGDLNLNGASIKITSNKEIEMFSQNNRILTRNGGTVIKGDSPYYGITVV